MFHWLRRRASNRDAAPAVMLRGHVTISNLPPHFGLLVGLAFFKVDGPESVPPYNGDPPGDAVTDCLELYRNVALDSESESAESTRTIPFSVEHSPGWFYIQLRTTLLRKHGGKLWAQVEPFFFGRRPVMLLQDLPSVTLPVEWPSTPIEELEDCGTVHPNAPFEPPSR